MNRRLAVLTSLLLVGSLLGVVVNDLDAEPPQTRISPTTDTYHGTQVSDPYRWLEDATSDEVKIWGKMQNEIARSFLDSLPRVDELRKEITRILSHQAASFSQIKTANGTFFAMMRQPPKQQPMIVTMPSIEGVDQLRVVVDPNQLDPDGLTSIDWYKVSPDGKQVAVSLSVAGSELGELNIFETSSGKRVGEKIARVNSGTAGGSLSWTRDSQAFYYTRHFSVDPGNPEDHRVYQHVYYHVLGTDIEKDRYELGQGFPVIAEIQLVQDNASDHLLATVQEGDGGNFAHYLRRPNGEWQQFSQFGDGVKQAVFGPNERLYLVSLADAPRGKLLELPLGKLEVEQAKTLVAERDETLVTGGIPFWGEETVVPTQNYLYLVYQQGGPSVIRVFDKQGQAQPDLPQLPISSVHGLLAIDADDLLFGNVSFVEPNAYYLYQPSRGESTKTPLATSSPVDLSDAVVQRKFARSKDGTRVPLNIVMRKGTKLDGTNPCVITGYGGYGINNEPAFRPLNSLYLNDGIIYVVTNLRGGAEYGEQWHREGNLTNKQNVFDDFAACIRYMIDNDYTRPTRTAIIGGSNGGLLMGATLTQHPERLKAVVSFVGIYDMLRVELSPNGAFNVTEFGTVKNRDQFEVLYSYSPYHNVVDGVRYPATLFVTGENDPRVDPMQSRKMTARLQTANAAETPILLRTSATAGHGGGNSLSERIEQSVDVTAFLMHYLLDDQDK